MTTQLDRIEYKLDQILVLLATNSSGDGGQGRNPKSKEAHRQGAGVLTTLTTKQHAALQMLLRGADNAEIADRFGVTDNTAKVHVRSIAKKVGVNTRAQIVYALYKEFEEIDDNGYMMMTGGLPKDWDANYSKPDPFWRLYGEKRHDFTADTEK